MLMAGSATAFGRLEFPDGPFRLQLLHMKMKKVTQDIGLCMPREINFDDVLTISWTAAMARMKISNKGKDIKKNDSSFEKHDQFITVLQSNFLINMFDNYHFKSPSKINEVKSLDDVVGFVLGMLDFFDVPLFYDPQKQHKGTAEDEDDLLVYCKVSTLRLNWVKLI